MKIYLVNYYNEYTTNDIIIGYYLHLDVANLHCERESKKLKELGVIHEHSLHSTIPTVHEIWVNEE